MWKSGTILISRTPSQFCSTIPRSYEVFLGSHSNVSYSLHTSSDTGEAKRKSDPTPIDVKFTFLKHTSDQSETMKTILGSLTVLVYLKYPSASFYVVFNVVPFSQLFT